MHRAAMTDAGMFANRLRKNARHLKKWAARQKLTAFRLYDRDIPDYPFVVDWYSGLVHVLEYPRRKSVREGTLETQRAEVLEAVKTALETKPEDIFISTHLPKAWRDAQYQATGQSGKTQIVEENGLKFEVRLGAYLDSGLFMDHRETRKRVREEARGHRFLNLFAYTGSFSVYAAAGGAKTTTVDLSGTYLDWARRNFALNTLSAASHTFVQADVLQWLAQEKGTYDLIVLDPPSHSASKRMERTFDVQRDQRRLIANTVSRLASGGILYFSTNYLGFQLAPQTFPDGDLVELTPMSLPEDFRQRDIHRCWRFTW
ncbi:MAG: class I SAM-dependent methyltransferase [Myxococcaceae bacterium]